MSVLSYLRIVILLIFLIYNSFLCSITSAVTIAPQGGRLGNSLLAYAYVKWFSYFYGLEMFYTPFPYSEQLMLGINCKVINREIENNYKKVILDRSPFNSALLEHNNILYEIPWFVPFEYEGDWARTPFEINWQDPVFLELLRRDICPRDHTVIDAVKMPANKISIAVHVRKGSPGIDLPLLIDTNDKTIASDLFWPQKFPPDSFYIEHIKYISGILGNPPIYVHIFTDHESPEKIAEEYSNILNLSNLEFGYRTKKNCDESNVLEDLFGMAKCDHLIMPASCYSYVASKIGNHNIVIMPSNHYWKNGQLIIDKVKLISR